MKNKIFAAWITLIFGLIFISYPGAVQAQNNISNDQKIAESVQKRLQDHKVLKNNEINITVIWDTVILIGTVSNIRLKNKVGEQACKATKKYIITNNLEIAQSSLIDQQLQDNIVKQLHKDAFSSIFDWVEFDFNNGVVTLTGWVNEPWHKKTYEHAIEKVPGVIKIDNEIQIESHSIYDDDLRNQAANLIYNIPLFNPSSLDENVSSSEFRTYAANLIYSDPWYRSYTSNDGTDDEFGNRPSNAIFNDPSYKPYSSIHGAPIHIIVNDGKIFLEGVVAKSDMSNWAENIIHMNTKAFQVYNNLEVER